MNDLTILQIINAMIFNDLQASSRFFDVCLYRIKESKDDCYSEFYTAPKIAKLSDELTFDPKHGVLEYGLDDFTRNHPDLVIDDLRNLVLDRLALIDPKDQDAYELGITLKSLCLLV